MQLLQSPLPHRARRQAGFTLVEVTVALLLVMLLAVFAAKDLRRKADESAAESTGRYLMQIRGAVVDLQLKHEAWLRGENLTGLPAGAYPTPPTLTWATVGGAQVARGGLSDLTALGLLPATIPRYPTLGDAARFILVRQGSCPGVDCRTSAFVYACHPISAARSLRQNADCTPPAVNRSQFDQTLLSKVVLAAEGYGGHDASGSNSVRGPLMDIPRAWFDFGTEPGHAVIAASLDATPFGQFVRHGETRPVTLHNTLTVGETIQSNKGLLLNTSVAPGAACTIEGLYASTANKMLAVCTGGVWFTPFGHMVTGVYSNLPTEAAVPALTCPAGQTPWRYASIQSLDVTVTGTDVNVGGSVGGTIQGSGSVNAAGSVTVNGTFAGSFQNSGSSYVRVDQTVAMSGDRVVISPAGANARAAVIQGCRN
ncbi:prepilin-type N-terminal cleavage/methylation domain-containing protein [Achromobacter mucicolens]|uniref:prepilin-type N-terminal cleavage/methylation domain-containing protein n=1 Tax=Achromobacter mucicolens TaxID=1389922 RepID=UPI003975D5CD